ncbi:Holliday junction branch migration protein RuvA [Desulfovibrio psychrotolerans]|uniref:Holliday junction branch migration complex subunit RuvA n=1 Tax=Desulfovibrio psychrotolerans TaxID=415242 RepID=A0A7J0BUM1_9BACT|nr:Holliday junction branch migration protein RuvA [Desulfovibrio psychrotolerans]GFM37409.1 Holliday junction ATP-dependent DNA helicase RuvA [Desulfovibrio psychrotolerans]
MIAYLEGRLAEVAENAVVLVTAGGVGYLVHLPVHTLARLPASGEPLAVFTYTVVREDALELYGFHTWDERQTFAVLISISKVGARTALAILSQFRPADLRQVVAEDDVTALTRVSGIGKKSAQHIFLELKYKLKVESVPGGAVLSGAAPGSLFRDALAGLCNLGYSEDEAAPVLKNVLKEEPDLDVGGALRAALKALGRGR